MQRVGEPSRATTGHPRRGVVRWTSAGFGLGVVSAAAYLLLGGEYFPFVPRWAYIVFYPGFIAGTAAFDLGLRQDAPKVVGVLAVGFSYATLAALARFAWFAFKYRRKSTAAKPRSQ